METYLSGFNLLAGIDGQVRVCSDIVGFHDTDVQHLCDARVFLQRVFQGGLVGVAGVVATHDDAERGLCAVCCHFFLRDQDGGMWYRR